MNIQIDEEFEKLIPPLTADEYEQLEVNIVARGCRDALVIWKETGILIDGHNRYHICKKNDIPFKTVEESFEDRDDAKAWIIQNQVGRRNLSAFQRGELAIVLKPIIEKKAKAHQGQRTDLNICQNSDKSVSENIDTKKELAKIAGVSHDTIHKTEVIKKEGTEEQVERARKGGKGNSINAVYNEIRGKEKKEKPKEPPAQTGSDNDAHTDFGPDGFDDFDFPNVPLQTAGAANPPADRQNETPDNDADRQDGEPQDGNSVDAVGWDETDDELIDIMSWQFRPKVLSTGTADDFKSIKKIVADSRNQDKEIPRNIDIVLEELEGVRQSLTENIVGTFETYTNIINNAENRPQLRGFLQKMKHTLDVLERRYLDN